MGKLFALFLTAFWDFFRLKIHNFYANTFQLSFISISELFQIPICIRWEMGNQGITSRAEAEWKLSKDGLGMEATAIARTTIKWKRQRENVIKISNNTFNQ